MQVVPISQIKPNPKNPRIIKDDKFKKLCKSIEEFPEMLEKRPLVCFTDTDGKFVVLGGNMRLKASKEVGLKELPILLADDWTEEQKNEFLIKDNVGFGEWDWEELQSDWDTEQLEDWGLDVPEFEEEEVLEAVEDDFDATPPAEPKTVLGDLYEIGEHRLFCGDSTDSDDVVKLLNGKEPYLMVTDPPYGVNYDPSWRDGKSDDSRWTKTKIGKGKVSNDDEADWTASWGLSPSKVAYIYHGGKHTTLVAQSLEDANFVLRSQIIWVKQNFVFSRGDYHWQHEPIWYAVKKGSSSNWAGDRKQTTIWNIQGRAAIGDTRNLKGIDATTGHGTQKPVECMSKPILNHDGDVYDPFLGSGSTMVASHQLKRKCYGMELDPKYCDVIVKRMITLDPTLTIKRNGVDVTNEWK